MRELRIGTRGSQLALRQTELLVAELERVQPGIKVKIKIIKTQGDKNLDLALSKIGDKGLFTKEIERELIHGEIDLAVHSMKDLPSDLVDGCCLGAVLKRENPADVLIASRVQGLEDLSPGARVGTGSLRRIAQLKSLRPDLQICPLRGNVETRIRKMKEEDLDAIILAYAGVKRLGLEEQISQVIPMDWILPAGGQGAIAIELHQADQELRNMLARVNHQETFLETASEQAFLAELGGGCQVPVACLAQVKGKRLEIEGLVASLEGDLVLRANRKGNLIDSVELGKQLAGDLLAKGAGVILDKIKQAGEQ